MLETFCEFAFDAAHKTTPDTPLHGHTFRVRVVLTGEAQPVFGWTHDLRLVEPVIWNLRDRLSHTHLNDIEGLEIPTLENVARWIWDQLSGPIKGLSRIEVCRGFAGAVEGVAFHGATPPADRVRHAGEARGSA
jgi:6-pyruvoyltetrahydropterin/6-carboxytetrahydropterin synthase